MTLKLYIPLRSDKTNQETQELAVSTDFISHYVQIKPVMGVLTYSIFIYFISHYVQIKQIIPLQAKWAEIPLYPTTFR